MFLFLHVENKKDEVQRSEVTCVSLYGWEAVEPMLELPLCLAGD